MVYLPSSTKNLVAQEPMEEDDSGKYKDDLMLILYLCVLQYSCKCNGLFKICN